MDINRMLRSAILTGEVRFGLKEARAAIRSKKAKLLILANDCPGEEFKPHLKSKVIFQFNGNNAELGTACGKPFGISVLTVIKEGESNILSLRK